MPASVPTSEQDLESAADPKAPTGRPRRPGRNVFAAIGIERYQHDSWQSLSNAVSNARGTAELFGKLGFDQVAVLFNDQATSQAIEGLVTAELQQLGPEDSLVLFYAGHGSTRSHQIGSQTVKTGYLIPFDASDRTATWIELDRWLRAVSLLPAKHILVILDACHSGIALSSAVKWQDGGAQPDPKLSALRARRSRRIITCALDNEVALDSGPMYGHSLFTGCLLEALTHGVGYPGSRVVTGSELGLYLRARMADYSRSRQTPDLGAFDFDDRGEMEIPFVMGPMRIAIDAAPADPFQQCVKKIVHGEKEWPPSRGNDAAEIEVQRQSLVHEFFDGAELVDLVGHSTPKSCYLRLGDWVLNPAEAERLASYLPESVKIVRLIGCGTASTTEGQAAVKAFTRHGLSAYGTRNKVYTTHFDQYGVKRGMEAPQLAGFLSSGCVSSCSPDVWQPSSLDGQSYDCQSQPLGPKEPLAPAAPLAPAGPAGPAGPLSWFSRCAWVVIAVLSWLLARCAWSTVAVLRWGIRRILAFRGGPRSRIMALLDPRRIEMPGLLTDPLLTFEIMSGQKAWTLEILFDFELARFYSSAHSVAERDLVYKIRGSGWMAKTPLEGYLERAPRGVTLIHDHEEAGNRCDRVPERRRG